MNETEDCSFEEVKTVINWGLLLENQLNITKTYSLNIVRFIFQDYNVCWRSCRNRNKIKEIPHSWVNCSKDLGLMIFIYLDILIIYFRSFLRFLTAWFCYIKIYNYSEKQIFIFLVILKLIYLYDYVSDFSV